MERFGCGNWRKGVPGGLAPDGQLLQDLGRAEGTEALWPNLFYGTGIPACIVVIDKENAHTRESIFMIDASSGFMKNGPKHRLRAMDFHKIVDVFNRQHEVPEFPRMVSVEEIEKDNFNWPRYIGA